MWGTTPDQDNNNVAQPAPQLPGAGRYAVTRRVRTRSAYGPRRGSLPAAFLSSAACCGDNSRWWIPQHTSDASRSTKHVLTPHPAQIAAPIYRAPISKAPACCSQSLTTRSSTAPTSWAPSCRTAQLTSNRRRSFDPSVGPQQLEACRTLELADRQLAGGAELGLTGLA